MDRHEYMKTLSDQIRWKRAVPLVEKELEGHIEEQKADFMASGMTEGEAETAAVAEMGDPVEVGVDMDRIHRPKMDWPAIAVIGLLSFLGLGIRYYLELHAAAGDETGFLTGSFAAGTACILVGLGIMAGICLLDYTRIAYRARELMILYFIILAAGMGICGTSVNGSRAFIYLYFFGPVSINVRMALLLFIPLYCAVLYRYRGQGYGGLLKGILWSAPMMLLSWWFSLSALNVLMPTVLIVLSAAVAKGYFKVNIKRALLVIWGTALSFLAVSALCILKYGAGYQAMRLRVMLNPGAYAREGSYQFYAVRKLLEGSRLVGKGADVAEAAGAVPDSMSFVLAYIVAYFGVLAAVLVTGAIMLLLVRLASHTWRQANRLGMLMGIGCGAALLTEIIWYLLTNLGIIIPGSVYCPFITYGNTGAAVTYILLGFMLSIYRYQNGVPEVQPEKTALFGKKRCQE